MSNEVIFDEDIDSFKDIVERFNILQDTDYSQAYQLHKEALAQYDRWSTIFFEVRRSEVGSKKDPALKDRIEHILKILNNIYTSARMVWNKSTNDLNEGKY
ncbi:hypothetical protein [Clostridium sp. HMP27]|uniref:hypothetical protein n=1 Tax=Clostridium sp. HMP27 TaxID=1487921 RepID=UPI00052D2A75|nr:hypothetical protein [Clostridium sp. HMP27]KGK88021.1 hypothetical protein DP68_08805 [Clostridium sp. HMP27]